MPSLCKTLPCEKEIEIEHGNTNKISFIPTHVLYKHMAYEINDNPIYIGTDVKKYNRYINLNSNSPGVSRTHCSIFMQGNHCIIRDASRYGSYLNEQKLKEETILHNGDLLKIGSPSVKFTLISIDKNNGQ